MDIPDVTITRRSILRGAAGAVGAVALAPASAALAAAPQPAAANDQAWADAISAALGGTPGRFTGDGVYEVDIARSDITLALFGIPVKPELALETEFTFIKLGETTVMKAELVLLDMEVNPFLILWLAKGLQPGKEVFSALHNHYLRDDPPIRFMHVFAAGGADQIAGAVYDALNRATGTPFGQAPAPPGMPGFRSVTTTAILGGEGMLSNGVLTVTVARKETFTQRGYTLPTEMEFSSVFKFQAIGGGRVMALAEFLVLKDEVGPVSKRLIADGIHISALHNHELDVMPQVYYLHAWKLGDAVTTAQRLRAALNLTNSTFV